MRVQFGSGPNLLDGWLNLQEHDDDITKPLNFANDSVDFIFTEHCLEHVTPLQGFCFLKECYRILKPKGVVRVIVPDVEAIWYFADQDYIDYIGGNAAEWWRNVGAEPPIYRFTRQFAFETILRCHGHKAAYSRSLLLTFLRAAGFAATSETYGKSNHLELNDIDSHWIWMGLKRAIFESVVVEGVKL